MGTYLQESRGPGLAHSLQRIREANCSPDVLCPVGFVKLGSSDWLSGNCGKQRYFCRMRSDTVERTAELDHERLHLAAMVGNVGGQKPTEDPVRHKRAHDV